MGLFFFQIVRNPNCFKLDDYHLSEIQTRTDFGALLYKCLKLAVKNAIAHSPFKQLFIKNAVTISFIKVDKSKQRMWKSKKYFFKLY